MLGPGGADLLGVDVLRPAAAERHTMSAMLKIVAEATHQRLLASDSRDSTRMLSAGGPNAGKSLTAPAGLKTTHFCDEEFTEIVCWRLGIAPENEPTLCQNMAAAHDRCCEEVMNKFCDHAMCCSNGPLRIRRHEDVADCLADAIEETGAHVRREAYIKAFSTADSEAWLDIWAFGGMHLPELIVDVTIRHPTVSRYQPKSSREAAAAATMAEKDKQQRYPPTQGRVVTPFAMETWGRLGNDAEEMLTTLAAEATRHARRHGHVVTAGSFMRRWRASLDASLQRGVAAALLAARYGLPGTSHRKRWHARR